MNPFHTATESPRPTTPCTRLTRRLSTLSCTSLFAVQPRNNGIRGNGSTLVMPASQLLSSKSSFFATSNNSLFLPSIPLRTTCFASGSQFFEPMHQTARKLATALALAAIVTTSDFVVESTRADVVGLIPCKESKGFAKREKQEIKKLESRLKLYAPQSAPTLAINATIEKTKRRFAFYHNESLLCGTDGLPHLIMDGDQKHLGEFVYPGLVFLYIARWIGWVDRAYLINVRTSKKPTDKEIIIDVPLALRIMSKGLTWPVVALGELRNGKLVEKNNNITISSR